MLLEAALRERPVRRIVDPGHVMRPLTRSLQFYSPSATSRARASSKAQKGYISEQCLVNAVDAR